jgi:hypothetical protein
LNFVNLPDSRYAQVPVLADASLAPVLSKKLRQATEIIKLQKKIADMMGDLHLNES